MLDVQGDSERWTQFQLAIFPELYVAFEFCKLHLIIHTWKFINVQCTPPSGCNCSSGWVETDPMVLYPHVGIPVFYQPLIVGIVYFNNKCSSSLEVGC
jgi:hypothetical protein